LQHFRDPMAGATRPTGDLMAGCDSDFEREILSRLVARGYRVRPQVGALGYRIDLVVEGAGDRRLAVECDGDQYHGPERWADDMRRQRVLERVGWRFWRCWSSSFTIDPEGCMADLFETLDRLSIRPMNNDDSPEMYIEQRVAHAGASAERTQSRGPSPTGVRLGDRVVIRYLDDNKTATYTLSEQRDDPVNGFVAVTSPLGKQLLGLTEEDEAEFDTNGQVRRILVVRADRMPALPN
jgi:very-short-patch-repair endonuclease